MVELIINNNQIELPKGTSIKYTKQISDIFDLASVACSYTNSFEFDKTPLNSQTMQQLGINGDSSTIPYVKNTAVLKNDGFNLISSGWFKLSNTDEKYNGNIIDGMIDFFKAIENKTIGKDLDLSNFEHEKIMETVVSSFTNEYYNYIIADYGGKTIFNDGINIDYLTPCFYVKRLWELIFSTFGFNCNYINLSYLDELYITYPKDLSAELILTPSVTLNKESYVYEGNRSGPNGYSEPLDKYSWDSSTIIIGNLLENWSYVISESASYNFNLDIAIYVKYGRSGRSDRSIPVNIYILKNNVIMQALYSDWQESGTTGDARFLNFEQSCNVGDIIQIKIEARNRTDFIPGYYTLRSWHHEHTNFIISKVALGNTSLQDEFKDFSIKDFIKEVVWRTGLTPILNKETNTVNFLTLESRIDFENYQDFSHCFSERTNEIYENNYAQKNIFKLKNNSDTDTTGDGYLFVKNENLDDEKILVQSKIYAPDKNIITSFGSFNTNQYKIWETETKENDGIIELNYKGLSGRFYFIRKSEINGSFKLTSEKLVDEIVVNSLPISINKDTLFYESINNYYYDYQKIFNNFRIHNIVLSMSLNDFIGFDLTKPVFFMQENAYYICNKLTYDEEKSTGEFIKINK